VKRALALIALSSLAAGAVAQGFPDQGQGQTRPPPPDQPRQGGNGGGVGVSVDIGKLFGKKKPKDPPPAPPLEMRDAVIPDYLPDQVIFVIIGQTADPETIARAAKVTIIDAAYLDEAGVSMIVTQIAPSDTLLKAQARLTKIKGVGWAQPNYQFQLLGKSLPKRFALHAIPEKQPRVAGKLVMIDAPVDIGHDNLKGAQITQSYFGVAQAPAMHGTVVAALLAGTGQYPGTAQGATLTSLAAFGPAASGANLSRTSYLAKAMNEASRLRPDVLNLSFGGPVDWLLGVMLDTIHKNGVCVSAAAGNGGPTGKILFPATHPASLAVTAVDENLRGYAYASQGPRVDVSGVGVGLNAAVPGGRRAVSGTSFATAVISGALLRMPACNGSRNPGSMKAQVAGLAQDLGVAGRDSVYGAGLFRLSASGNK
jgi:Subtilase family